MRLAARASRTELRCATYPQWVLSRSRLRGGSRDGYATPGRTCRRRLCALVFNDSPDSCQSHSRSSRFSQNNRRSKPIPTVIRPQFLHRSLLLGMQVLRLPVRCGGPAHRLGGGT
eukprot:scaffold3884_cov392-Prasinococcus_capsulatus_cf.AAC.23